MRWIRAALFLPGAALCLSHLMAQPVPRNAAPGVRYVGSRICAGCHAQIYSSYIKTGMGRSIVPGGDKSLLARLPPSFSLFDPDPGQFFEVVRKEDTLYQSQYAVDHDGKEVFRQTWALAYAVGAGENGFGFIVRRGKYLFEAPLTYFSRSHTWGLSPGYEVRNYAFTRPILAQCIGCHSGRPEPVAGQVGAYRAPPFAELAIGCENCHGPGALHVAARQTGHALAPGADSSIVNPARLTGRLADHICMKCHQGGDVRVLQPGKQEQDFRPGTSLDTVLAIFKAPLDRDSPPQSVLVEHYFGMTLSKCYRSSAGRLGCITCHNPHAQASGPEAVGFYRAKCLGCHRPESCKLGVEQRRQKSPADDCASCHMPKRTVTTITHAALTDHMIAASHGEPYPEEAFASHTMGDSGLLHITGQPDEPPSSTAPVTLLQAYTGLIRDGHKQFAVKRDTLLDRLSHTAPEDPVVLVALGRKAALKDTPEDRTAAVRYLTRALQNGANAPDDFLLLAEIYSRENRHVEAIRLLQKGREVNPYFRELQEQIAAQHMALGQYGDALQVIRAGLELFPDDIRLRLLDRQVRAATLDDSVPK